MRNEAIGHITIVSRGMGPAYRKVYPGLIWRGIEGDLDIPRFTAYLCNLTLVHVFTSSFEEARRAVPLQSSLRPSARET